MRSRLALSGRLWGRTRSLRIRLACVIDRNGYQRDYFSFEAFKRHVEAQEVRRLDAPPGVASNGIWFHDHKGVLIELKAAEKISPNAKSSFKTVSSPDGVAAAMNRTAARAHLVRPRLLAHLLVFVVDVPAAIASYSRGLGLRVSDHSGRASSSCMASMDRTIT
jgi:hypothetical protein